MKGDIISNYFFKDGQLVIDKLYRKGEPSLQFSEDRIGGLKAFWVSSNKASGDSSVIVYFHGGGFVEGEAKSDSPIIICCSFDSQSAWITTNSCYS
jgi:acetyl esterase/lipase